MAVGGAELVLVHTPVVGQLQHRALLLVLVADEGERELAVRVVAGGAAGACPAPRCRRRASARDRRRAAWCEGFAWGSSSCWRGSVFAGEAAAIGRGGRDHRQGRRARGAGLHARCASPDTGARPPPRSAASGSSRPDARPRARPRSRSAPARGGSAASAGGCRSGCCSCPSAWPRSTGSRRAPGHRGDGSTPPPVRGTRPAPARAARAPAPAADRRPPAAGVPRRRPPPRASAPHAPAPGAAPAHGRRAARWRRRPPPAAAAAAPALARAGGRAARVRGCARSARPRPAGCAAAPTRARRDDRPGVRTSVAPSGAAPDRPGCPRRAGCAASSEAAARALKPCLPTPGHAWRGRP